MPLYVTDYLRKTQHLRALESGAYLHLIMAYWAEGGLPNDDRQLATLARMTDAEWKRAKPLIAPFFGPNFSTHERIDFEIARAADVSEKRRSAALQKHGKRIANGREAIQ